MFLCFIHCNVVLCSVIFLRLGDLFSSSVLCPPHPRGLKVSTSFDRAHEYVAPKMQEILLFKGFIFMMFKLEKNGSLIIANDSYNACFSNIDPGEVEWRCLYLMVTSYRSGVEVIKFSLRGVYS